MMTAAAGTPLNTAQATELLELGVAIQEEIRRETGLQVSVSVTMAGGGTLGGAARIRNLADPADVRAVRIEPDEARCLKNPDLVSTLCVRWSTSEPLRWRWGRGSSGRGTGIGR